MFCYITYSLLDWPGIHTCLITCYIVSLGTTAETVEKLTLRIVGCALGAIAGIAALVFLMPNVTSIGALMAIVFAGTLIPAWIAAGSPRVSYIGFQLAFAFFLCVIQGNSPAFDMTVARDRVIGILFGNVVVWLLFTQVFPVSVANRIDPAIAALLRRIAKLAGTDAGAPRWAVAAEARASLGAISQDLSLSHYEPASVAPGPAWVESRTAVTDAMACLPGPLLIMDPDEQDRARTVAARLERLAQRLHPTTSDEASPVAPGHEHIDIDFVHTDSHAETIAHPGTHTLSDQTMLDAALKRLETAIARATEPEAHHAAT